MIADRHYLDIDMLLLEPSLFEHPDISAHSSPTVPSAPEQPTEREERLSVGIKWAIQAEQSPRESSSAVELPPSGSAVGHLSSIRVPIKAYRPERRREETFVTLQAWEGLVLEVEDEVIQVRLTSAADGTVDQYAEIYLTEVDSADQELVKKGAEFYWSIGYLQKPYGTTMRASILRFRRLPALTSKDMERAESEFTEWKRLFVNAD